MSRCLPTLLTSRFPQVTLSFCPETFFFLSHAISTTFMRPLRELCLPSSLSFSPCGTFHPFRFLASALTFISFYASSILSRQLQSHPRRRHQQTSWLYRESHLDYEPWLEAGRLAHRSCREVPVLSLPLPHTSLNFALELYTLSRCPSLSPASVAFTFVTMESIRTLEVW